MSLHDRDDDARTDARLRAALDHAPDRALRPSPGVREAVRRAAQEAAARQRPLPWWRRPWSSGPGLLGVAASLATVGLGLSLAWNLSTVEPLREPAVMTQALPPSTAEQAAAPASTPQAGFAAAPPATAPSPLADDKREMLARRKTMPAPEKRLSPSQGTQAAEAPAAAAPPAPVTAAAPAVAEAQSPTGSQSQAPEASRARDAAALAPMSVAKSVAPSGLRSEAPTPWPAPLARWAQALFDAGAGVDQPEGWQRVQPAEPFGTPAARRDWWLALLSRTSGRWASEAPPPTPASSTLQWRAPDGAMFSLWLDADHAWLQADGRTWRAPRPPGLAPAP